MNISEKFCLKWNDFQENTRSVFQSLREDVGFADVTLACEDGHQIEAHKVILAASSPVFQNLLKRNNHAHPLIYMRGMKSGDLVAIVDFLYIGEANIFQDNLDSFLVIAEELKLKGLTGNVEDKIEEQTSPNVPQEGKVLKTEKNSSHTLTEYSDYLVTHQADNATRPRSENTVALNDMKISVGMNELDRKIKSMMRLGENLGTGSWAGRKVYVCNVCGKEGQCGTIKDHIEANHIDGVSHPCNTCDKTFR